jgi:hypothetical protein
MADNKKTTYRDFEILMNQGPASVRKFLSQYCSIQVQFAGLQKSAPQKNAKRFSSVARAASVRADLPLPRRSALRIRPKKLRA